MNRKKRPAMQFAKAKDWVDGTLAEKNIIDVE